MLCEMSQIMATHHKQAEWAVGQRPRFLLCNDCIKHTRFKRLKKVKIILLAKRYKLAKPDCKYCNEIKEASHES